MSEIHALSGAYAVDALDDDERHQFEEHLAACPECRAEVRSFSETAALLAETAAETPPPSLRDSVLSGIASTRPLPPEAPPETAPEAAPDTDPETAETAAGSTARPTTGTAPESAGEQTPATVVPLRRRAFPMLVAASVVLILLAVGAAIWHPWTGSQSSNLADRIRQAPDAVTVSEPLPGGGELTLVRSKSLDRAVMIGSDVPEAEPGTTYQLWLQQPGRGMVSAGLMNDATEPTVLTGDAATATAAAVTVEPEAGSEQPTSDPIALFPLPPTGGTGST